MSANWDSHLEERRLEFSNSKHPIWKQKWIHVRPYWAHWLAQDASGVWWAYEHEPNQSHQGWYENEIGNCMRVFEEMSGTLWQFTLMHLEPH